jgi:multicomponent Na+:H+ antiporter subunit C
VISTLAFGLTGAALVAIGFYGFVTGRPFLRQVLAFNVIGSGAFLLFGALARRDPAGGSDPVPHAMIITGIVVALAATALAVALVGRFHDQTGEASVPDAEGDDG